MTDYGDGVFMQDERSALLRRVSLALSIFWGIGLVSMVCTSAILQNSSLHSQIDPQVYQQAVDSLHGRTSIPLSMLALAAFEVVTGIVGYRAGKHDGKNTPALVLGIVSVAIPAIQLVAHLPQLNVGNLIALVLSILYVYGVIQTNQHYAGTLCATITPGKGDRLLLRRMSITLMAWSTFDLVCVLLLGLPQTPLMCTYMIVRLLIGIIGHQASTHDGPSDTRRILLMGIFLSAADAVFTARDCYRLIVDTSFGFPLGNAIDLFMSVLFLLGAIRLRKGAAAGGAYETGDMNDNWEGINGSRLGW